MFITSMIVKVAPSKAMEVSRLLGHIPKLAIYGVYKGENIIVVVEANTALEVENLSKQIASKCSDVLSVCQGSATPDIEARPSNIPVMKKAKPVVSEKFGPGGSRRLPLRPNTSSSFFDVGCIALA